MYNSLQKIRESIEPILNQNNSFLIELRSARIKDATRFTFFIDKEISLTIDDCYSISRQIEKFLLDENLIDKKDQIEVSSPGADRPLIFLKQYPKYIGKEFLVIYNEGEQKLRNKMKLLKVEDNTLFFDFNGSTMEITFNNIVEAKTILSFK